MYCTWRCGSNVTNAVMQESHGVYIAERADEAWDGNNLIMDGFSI